VRCNKIDEDPDSADLQKALKAKCDKIKKIGEKRAKRAAVAFEGMGLSDAWASLELDIHNKYGEASLEALKKWEAAEPVALKARLAELGASEEQREQLSKALAELAGPPMDIS